MKLYFILAIISLGLLGCSSGNKDTEQSVTGIETASSDTTGSKSSLSQTQTEHAISGMLDSLHIGMSGEQVIALLGEPTKKETVSTDPKVVVEDWWFGENQKVRMVRGQVNNVVKDVAYQKELLRKLAEAKKNNDQAAVDKIMEELTRDLK